MLAVGFVIVVMVVVISQVITDGTTCGAAQTSTNCATGRSAYVVAEYLATGRTQATA
ncbi:hypothetical protein D3C77_786390 [compost metagenome]